MENSENEKNSKALSNFLQIFPSWLLFFFYGGYCLAVSASFRTTISTPYKVVFRRLVMMKKLLLQVNAWKIFGAFCTSKSWMSPSYIHDDIFGTSTSLYCSYFVPFGSRVYLVLCRDKTEKCMGKVSRKIFRPLVTT